MRNTATSADMKFITKPKPGADYVSTAEYIRRKHELDLTEDPGALKLYPRNVKRAIDRGDITVLKQGINLFIDWNKYKTFVFKRHSLSV